MIAPIALSRVESITGIDKASLKNEDIEEAWRIIGEQSEWVLEMLSVHKDDTGVTPYEIAQFLHFFDNMTQLSCAKRTVPFPFDEKKSLIWRS
jgi:hypothetical protein